MPAIPPEYGAQPVPLPPGLAALSPADAFSEVELPSESGANGIFIEQDGTITVDLDPKPATPEIIDHDANLAELMSDEERNRVAQEDIEAVKLDLTSREDWEAQYLLGVQLLGLKIEDRTYPFKGACGVYDSVLLEAVIRFNATAMSELLPPAGPVKTREIGVNTEPLDDQADRVSAWMNYYLTEAAPEYYQDRDQLLFWLPLVGSCFTKVYVDPELCRPVLPFITPDKLIVSYTTTSLDTCPRVTHETLLTKRQMRARQLSGFYRDVVLAKPDERTERTATTEKLDQVQGRTPEIHREDDRYTVWESHVDLDLKGFEDEAADPKTGEMKTTGLPLPYIMAVDKDSGQLLSLRKNWREGDPRKRKKQYFVHHKFLPGFGFYGLGYAHALGGSAKARTMILRQMVDSGTLNSFPGGLRVKGMRIEDNNLGIGPTEFREIDTGGLPIQNAVMTMPYKEPSQFSLLLYQDMGTRMERLAATTEIAVGDGRQDAPVGTTVALLEAAMKAQSGIIKRLHRSFGEEFRLLAGVFAEVLPDQPYPFRVQGQDKQRIIMKADFDNRIDVVPVSDPNIASSTQRLVRSDAIVQSALSQPQIHDMRAVFHVRYREMGLDGACIDSLLPQPKQAMTADPVTENQAIMSGMPVKVAPWQDHKSHIQVHAAMAEAPGMQAHIAEHAGWAFRQQIQQALGQELPPLGQPMPPEIENKIAALAASVVNQLPGNDNEQKQQIDPVAVAAADVQAKEHATQVRAKADADKTAVAAYTANVAAQAKQADIQSRERIAAAKTATQLAIARMRPATPRPSAN